MELHKAAKHGIDVVWFSCDQDGCEYKAKLASSIKVHKQQVHDIDVRWQHCTEVGCDYKAKLPSNLKIHKAAVHDIDVRWHHCTEVGCDYKAKQSGHLKRHKQIWHSNTPSLPASIDAPSSSTSQPGQGRMIIRKCSVPGCHFRGRVAQMENHNASQHRGCKISRR